MDICCVDQVVNHILIATAHCAQNPGDLHISQHSTTQVNPFYQKNLLQLQEIYKYYPMKEQVSKPWNTFVGSVKNQKMYVNLFQRLPI